MATGFKVSGEYIVNNGFPCMNSRFGLLSTYDLEDVIYTEADLNKYLLPAVLYGDGFKDSNLNRISCLSGGNMPWIKQLPLPYQERNGGQHTGIIKGTFPTFETCLFEIYAGLIWIFRRTDTALNMYTTTGTLQASWPAAYFRDGIVPYNFLFEMQGGGSGGAGTTYGCWTTNLDGAGGAGGGYVVGAMSFVSSDIQFRVHAGSGGEGGSTAIPSGANGTSGTNSYIYAEKFDLSNPSRVTNTLSLLYASGGVYSEIPVIQSTGYTRKTAGGSGGYYSVGGSASFGTNAAANLPLYIIGAIQGGAGGDPLNNYNGESVEDGYMSCIDISGYAKNQNTLWYTGGIGGKGSNWGSNNSKDGLDWTGSGGGGASALGDGAPGGPVWDSPSGYGAGGGGGYWSSKLSGTSGGNGIIRIYY